MSTAIIPFDVPERRNIVRTIFGVVILFEIYLFISNTLLFQFQQPVFKFLDLDITYYLLFTLGIPQFIMKNGSNALLFDSTLIALSILCFVFPLKRTFLIIFYVFFFIYLITRNSFGLSHDHLFNGVVFALFPFLFQNNLTSRFLWEFVRYVHLFVFSSAFLWKLFRGSLFDFNHLEAIMKLNLSPYLFENGDSIFSHLYIYLLSHPNLLFVLWLIGISLEAIFIIGFFTKKYDSTLFIIGIFLHLCFWFFADAFYFPILIISLPLLNFQRLTDKNEL